MKYIRSIIFISFLVISNISNGALSEASYLKAKTWKTKSGIPVYFVKETSLPIIDLDIIFAAGSAFDGELYGLSSMTTSLIGTKTRKLNEDEIIDQINDLGTMINSSNDRDSLTLSLRTLTTDQYLSPSIELYTQILNDSVFDEKIFNRIKNQYITSIKLDNQSPSDIAYKSFYKALYGNHPYAHPVNGTEESISEITLSKVRKFYRNYLVKNNAVITMVGNLTEAQAKSLAEEITEQLPQGQKPKPIPEPAPPKDDQIIHIPFPSFQTTILIGTLGIPKGSSKFYPLTVGNQYLGGSGLDSLLFDEVRKKRGLAYGAYSNLSTLKKKGTFIISTQTRNEKVIETISVIRDSVEAFLNNGVPSKNLDRAKKYITGSFPLSLASNRNKSALLGLIAFYQLPLDYFDTYTNYINQVINKEIIADFDILLEGQKLITVTVGSTPEIEDQVVEQQTEVIINEEPNS
ncbi:insulinase family protein [Francisellaceae bacterium]|nr:insulinase family protein [Francisellaceae bacterium]